MNAVGIPPHAPTPDIMDDLRARFPGHDFPFSAGEIIDVTTTWRVTFLYRGPLGIYEAEAPAQSGDVAIQQIVTTEAVLEVLGDYRETGQVVYKSGEHPTTTVRLSQQTRTPV